MPAEGGLPKPSALRRWLRAIAWLALVAGWVLVWYGHGVPGCALVALFAVIRLATARPAATLAQAGPPPPETAGTDIDAQAAAAHPFDPWSVEGDTSEPSPTVAPEEANPAGDPDSDTPARWRRLVWLSYGNAFLQGRIGLEDWYRHSLTWKAVCSFRDGSDRRLVAGDGFEWLSLLRQRGALRLSLDIAGIAGTGDTAPVFTGNGGVAVWDGQAITCHFIDHREHWRMGEENSDASRQAEGMEWEQRGAAFPLWGHGSYLPDVDTYWRVATLPGTEPEIPIDWPRESAAIGRALQQAGAVGYESTMRAAVPGPFFLNAPGEEPAWSRFPVLPDDPALPAPHRLLEELVRRKSAWDNATHPKNEGSLYAQTRDAKTLEAIEAHGALLLALIGRVQCLAGSETRWRPPATSGTMPAPIFRPDV